MIHRLLNYRIAHPYFVALITRILNHAQDALISFKTIDYAFT
jgi:hypothetical protein